MSEPVIALVATAAAAVTAPSVVAASESERSFAVRGVDLDTPPFDASAWVATLTLELVATLTVKPPPALSWPSRQALPCR